MDWLSGPVGTVFMVGLGVATPQTNWAPQELHQPRGHTSRITYAATHGCCCGG